MTQYNSPQEHLVTKLYELFNSAKPEERKFMLVLAESDIKDYIKSYTLDELLGSSVDYKKYKSKIKKNMKLPDMEKQVNVMTVMPIFGSLKVTAQLTGYYKYFAEAMIKKKIKKFVNNSKLTYYKLENIGDSPEVIYEIGNFAKQGSFNE